MRLYLAMFHLLHSVTGIQETSLCKSSCYGRWQPHDGHTIILHHFSVRNWLLGVHYNFPLVFSQLWSTHYIGFQTNNSVRNFSVMILGCFRTAREENSKAVGSHTMESQIDTLRCPQKNCNIKEDKGKSMIRVLCVLQLAKKSMSWDKAKLQWMHTTRTQNWWFYDFTTEE